MNVHCVVVGVDGSDDSRRALDWAITLASPFDARVVAVHALGLLDRLGDDPVPTATHREAIVEQFHAAWCAALNNAPVESERVVDDGPPADVLLGTAAAYGADVIVVGERGAGSHARGPLGSTSRRVLEESDRPVLVVPGGEPR